ncbi:hypothetical protein VaNZ11_006826 [Volvox africanus]|uniref:Phospholipid/glycerol acyltransferase domain-containing protein n=1 Tax=Volvox africanus TaxID=51714 RepID=A0ABQ5S1K7_9CHLO|nr:hypothetical protein VaNZ11_006826 [Volvox africanus]
MKMSEATRFVSGPNPIDWVESSPFIELGCPFTLYGALKMLFLLPLLPFRLAIGGLALVTIAVTNSLVIWNWPLEKPLPPWRRRVVLLSKELVLVTLWCLGFRIRVRGRENIKTAERLGAVAIFNHVSWIDAFVLVWLMAPSGVSKESNGRIPVIGQAVRAMQTVYIPYDKLSKRSGNCGDSGGGRGPGGKGTSTCPAVHVPKGGTSAAATMSPCSDCSSSSSSSNDKSNSSASSMRDLGRASSSSCSAIETNHAFFTDGAEGAVGGKAACAEAPPVTAGGAGAAAPAPAIGSHGRNDVVTSRVTEVLLRRVHHPSYCKPGGFPLVVMAPEGTTSNGRGLLNFRTGAFVLERPVLPICFRYRWQGLNPAWTIGDERWHFLRLMSQFRNDLEVEILPPYKPSFDELKDPCLFASHVRRQMASVLGIPLYDASHDDYLALRRRGVNVSWDGRHVIVSDTNKCYRRGAVV